MLVTPLPNPETVAALLDTTWRVAEAETARTESLDRKATSLVTFASVAVSLSATLGTTLAGAVGGRLGVAAYAAAIGLLIAAATIATRVLLPKEYLALGASYLSRFGTWSEIVKPPEQVRGETIQGLKRAIARERKANSRKANQIRLSLRLLLGGLSVIAFEALILGIRVLS